MKVKVVFFGQLEEFTQCKDIELNDVNTINELKEVVESKFPKLKSFNYLLAHNQEIATENNALNDLDELALLPPFAGG